MSNRHGFTVLRLPVSSQKRIIRILAPIDQLALSLCSQRSKKIVRATQLKISNLQVLFAEKSLSISVALFSEQPHPDLDLRFYEKENYKYNKLETPKIVNVDANQTVEKSRETVISTFSEWSNTNLGVREWIDHLLYIYNHHSIYLNFRIYREVVDKTTIYQTVKGLKVEVVGVWRQYSIDFVKWLITNFVSNRLTFYDSFTMRSGDSEIIKKIMLQNYDYVSMRSYLPVYFSSLDNILTINSSTLHIKLCNLSDKNLNRLFRLWMRGAMPRLERICFEFPFHRIINKETLFKGTNAIRNGYDFERKSVFHQVFGPEEFRIIGGYNIRRYDGTEATLTFPTSLRNNLIRFNVWFQ